MNNDIPILNENLINEIDITKNNLQDLQDDLKLKYQYNEKLIKIKVEIESEQYQDDTAFDILKDDLRNSFEEHKKYNIQAINKNIRNYNNIFYNDSNNDYIRFNIKEITAKRIVKRIVDDLKENNLYKYLFNTVEFKRVLKNDIEECVYDIDIDINFEIQDNIVYILKTNIENFILNNKNKSKVFISDWDLETILNEEIEKEQEDFYEYIETDATWYSQGDYESYLIVLENISQEDFEEAEKLFIKPLESIFTAWELNMKETYIYEREYYNSDNKPTIKENVIKEEDNTWYFIYWYETQKEIEDNIKSDYKETIKNWGVEVEFLFNN